jgi:hypothetical protein
MDAWLPVAGLLIAMAWQTSGSGPSAGEVTIGRAAGPFDLGPEPVRLTFTPSSGAAKEPLRLSDLPPQGQIFLVLQGLNAEEAPATGFSAYLNLPPGAAANPAAREAYRVGGFSYFNEIRSGRQDAPTTRRSYDLTSALAHVRASRPSGEPVTVTLLPDRPAVAPGAKAAIAGADLVIRSASGG